MDISTTPKDALNKVKNMAKADTSDYAANILKSTVNGCVTGGVLGLMIGFYKKYNLYASALAGIAIGGVAAKFLVKYNK